MRFSDVEWDYVRFLADQHHTTASDLIRECMLADMPETRDDQ